MKTKRGRRILSVLLAGCIACGSMLTAFAADDTGGENLELRNVALGKAVTGTSPNTDTKPAAATDGRIDCKGGNDYYEVGYNLEQNPDDPYYVQVDLGEVYPVEKIDMWRYYSDNRIYYDTIVFASEDDIFTAEDIVYNSDADNFFGYGNGTDEEYQETADGKEISFEAKNTRYIRVLNNGNDRPWRTGGHYVEIQAWAMAEKEKVAMEHAEPLEVPSFTAPGKEDGVTHPDVVKFDEPWNGYTYWMAVTPNQNGNSQFENPCLVASNDGKSWEVPEGITNPLTGVAEEPVPFHNCDTDMVYSAQDDTLYLYYVWSKDSPSAGQDGFKPSEVRLIKISHSENGFEVTEPQAVVTSTYRYDILSPSVVIGPDGIWRMWTVDTGDTGYCNQTNHVDLRTSEDGINWTEPESLAETFDQSGYQPWHIDMQYIPEKEEYFVFFPCYPDGGESGYTELFFARSKDGKIWTTYEKPVMKPRAGEWDNNFIYRSTFLYHAETDNIALWYSAGSSQGWKVAYTENTLEAMIKELGNSHTPEPSEPEGVQWVEVPALGGDIAYEDGWRMFTGEGIALTLKKDAKATLTFYGTGIRWIGQKDLNFGEASVYLDGELAATVNTQGSAQWGVTHFEKTGLEEGIHTISIQSNQDGVLNVSGAVDIEKFVVEYDTSKTIPVSSVELSADKTQIDTQDELQLSCIVAPFNALEKTVRYSSSDESVASVDETGKVIGHKAGTVTITASIDGTELKDSVEITVTEYVAVEKRMTVNNENPLLLVHLYGGRESESGEIPGIPGQGGMTLMGTWNMIPDDVKPYTAIQLHRGFLNGDDNPTLRTYFEENLKIAQENNVNIFLTIVTGGNANPVAAEWVDEMFDKYSCLKGLVFTENWYGGDHVPENIAKYLKVAAENGGYMVWTDANLSGNAMERWMDNQNLFNAAKKYKDNFIICSKSTASSGFANVRSVGMGYWLSDLCGNWGALTDSWYWYEKSYWRLFDQSPAPYRTVGGGYESEEVRCPFQFPETMFSMNMLQTYANGGVVFNFEHPFYCTGVNDTASHALTEAIIPVMEYILDHPAPTKEDVMDATKVVFSSRAGYMPSDFQYGLYGDQNDGNLMQNSGRYNTIPIIHKNVSQDILDRFDYVIDLNDVKGWTLEEKVAWFNEIYPEISTGDAYVQKIHTDGDPRWLVFNSNDNQNINQNTSIPLDNSFSQNIGFELTPHTYLLTEQMEDSLDITLNNYRANKDEIWEGYTGDKDERWNGDWNTMCQDYMIANYLPNPQIDELRPTVISLSVEAGSEKPELSISGDEGQYEYTEEYNQETGEYTLTINHNGQVFVNLKEGQKPVVKALLESTVEYALTLDTEGVAASAKAYFEKALAEAQAVLANPDATQEEVDAAWNNLLEGIWGLGITEGNKEMLNQLIAKADWMKENKSKYVETYWGELETALAEAKEVSANGDALQDEVDAATNALHMAIMKQRYQANKENLEELIKEVSGIDLNMYTEASAAMFRAALQAAEAVLADESLTEDDQAVVDDAEVKLLSAYEALEEKTNAPSEPSDPEKPSDPDNGKGEETPATGENQATVWLGAAMLLMTGMALVALKKQRYTSR